MSEILHPPRTGVPEGASSNPTESTVFSVDVSSVRIFLFKSKFATFF